MRTRNIRRIKEKQNCENRNCFWHENKMKGIIPQGTSALHFMLWKFLLIQLTLKSIKGTPIDPLEIIDKAVLRLHRRTKSLAYEISCECCKAEARENNPNISKFAKRLEGIGHIEDNKIILNDVLQTAIDLAT